MSDPFFSVIIPAHNAEKHIRKALDSIESQKFRDFELIVVCDSCEDGTEQIAREYTEHVLTVKYHRDGLTRDAGIRVATGQWLMFMDDDDWWLHEYVLSMLAERVGKHGEDIFVFGFINSGLGYITQHMDVINSDSFANVWAKCFRREIIGTAHFGNHIYCSDRYFLKGVLQNAWKIVFWDMPLYYYNWNRPGSQTDAMINGQSHGWYFPYKIYQDGKEDRMNEQETY